MGASVAVPDACALVISVRVEDPAAALIVIEVAFVVCQVTVTFCPELMDEGLTESVTVGAGVFAVPVEHPLIPAKKTDKVPKPIQQKRVFLIILYVSLCLVFVFLP